MKIYYPLFALFIVIAACTQSKGEDAFPDRTQVEIQTSKGAIVLALYDETPQHRDNFIKLIEEQFYDSILFHRVIDNFMIQAGDPDSKVATASDTLGDVDLPYKIPAEFAPMAFHKRGALGAARDGNIARASSSSQFYIVQGRTYTDSTLAIAEDRINNWLAQNEVLTSPENSDWAVIRDEVALENRKLPRDSIALLSNRLDSLANIALVNMEKYRFPEAHREIYKTAGGAAHLDQNYTVFGEVVQGMDVVDSIAKAHTNPMDRPITDIQIISARIIE